MEYASLVACRDLYHIDPDRLDQLDAGRVALDLWIHGIEAKAKKGK